MVPTSGASEAQTASGDSELQPVPDADWRERAVVRGAETEQPTTVRGDRAGTLGDRSCETCSEEPVAPAR